MTRATRCPAPELIVAARAGTLSTSLQHAVDAHVAQCEVCRTLGDALADDALTNLTPEESGRIRDRVHAGLAQSSRDLVRQRIWKAASAIVVVGLAAGTWMIVSSRRVEPTPGLPPGSNRPGAGRTTNAPLQPAQGPTHLHGVVTDAGGNALAGARVSEYTTRVLVRDGGGLENAPCRNDRFGRALQHLRRTAGSGTGPGRPCLEAGLFHRRGRPERRRTCKPT